LSTPKKPNKPEELSEEQFNKLVEENEQFDDHFFKILAGTDKYEIVPTLTDHGQPLTKEQYSLVKNECSRLGLSVIYRMDLPDGSVVYTSIENNKVGYIHEGIH
jgi:hypothetical protein